MRSVHAPAGLVPFSPEPPRLSFAKPKSGLEMTALSPRPGAQIVGVGRYSPHRW